MADATRAELAPLCSRRKGASAALPGCKNQNRATCYIAAFLISLLHVPTFSNLGLHHWKKACGCDAQQNCFNCHLAGQTVASCSPKKKGKAPRPHRLEWLFKRLNEVMPELIAPRRKKTDLSCPDSVSKHLDLSCRVLPRTVCRCCTCLVPCSIRQTTYISAWRTLPALLEHTLKSVSPVKANCNLRYCRCGKHGFLLCVCSCSCCLFRHSRPP